jgi:hypothetical protein
MGQSDEEFGSEIKILEDVNEELMSEIDVWKERYH